MRTVSVLITSDRSIHMQEELQIEFVDQKIDRLIQANRKQHDSLVDREQGGILVTSQNKVIVNKFFWFTNSTKDQVIANIIQALKGLQQDEHN